MKVSAAVLMLAVLIGASLSAEPMDMELTELDDTAERASLKAWFEHAETGARLVPDLGFLMVISPDERWILFGEPTGELDVETYRLYVLSTTDFMMRTICEQALDATFSPCSRFLFVPTGPHPVIFELAKGTGTALGNIESGLESSPVWVSEWSEDGTEMVIHQQARFDDASEPRAWKIVIAP
ncbi:hypothetical protein GF359_07325 [candidate division WOR-3 bacterium]|uniref:AraC family transcriptional regulator n=1 Tax=candidate division WOR-3 bacterium TaxID=2052148 RepID=A0A9D5K9R7_UNCW3|nr:hypothetical protein [candidate division WOR-3 bacterium]MBD3365011.1 hypothetical protein [candidate division WOR-3 bacterium]